MNKTLTIFVLCLLSTVVVAGERLPSLLVSNPWKLSSTSIGNPARMNVRGHTATFGIDGTWAFETTLDGAFEGVRVKGSGTWEIKDSAFIYTAGDRSGSSNMSIENGVLKFSPDPVLVFEGKKAIDTTYVISR